MMFNIELLIIKYRLLTAYLNRLLAKVAISCFAAGEGKELGATKTLSQEV
jgi:hypothetical protein